MDGVTLGDGVWVVCGEIIITISEDVNGLVRCDFNSYVLSLL
jgi:hypothetical protein